MRAPIIFLIGVVFSFTRATPQKEVLAWMCLERCGFNSSEIGAQLQQISSLLRMRALNAVNFELFNLGPHSTLVTNNLTQVAGVLRSFGVSSRRAMISSWPYPPEFLSWMREVFVNPEPFFKQCIDAARMHGLTGFDVDWEPTTEATKEDATNYAHFLDLMAARLHERGLSMQVDVAPWNSIWNLSLIGMTRVDRVMQMGTYAGNWTSWQRAFNASVTNVPIARLGIGLQSVDPNSKLKPPAPLTDEQLRLRFSRINAVGVRNIGLWMTPFPLNYVPFFRAFLGGNEEVDEEVTVDSASVS